MRNIHRGRWYAALFISLALVIGLSLFAARLRGLRTEPRRAFMTPTPSPTAAPAGTRKPPVEMPLSLRLSTPAPTKEPAHVLGSDTITIVLMGLDSNEEREARGSGYRSDTIALLVINTRKPGCTVINVPRDTRARVSRLNKEGKVTGRQYNKINSAFQLGGGPDLFGHENLMQALENLLFDGLRSDVGLGFYVSLDMDAIEQFAYAVGGVPVQLDYDIPGYGKAGETILLQGETARKFVRLRHGITGGSDIGRIGRQQAFVKAFAQRVQSMGAKEAVPKLWGALSGHIQTNLNAEQVFVLGDLLSRMDLNRTSFITLPGSCKTIEGRSYYVPNTKAINTLAIELWGE